MKHVDEYRDAHLIEKIITEIKHLADGMERVHLMEVCGGHTHAIHRFGLGELLPDTIELIHGPGCPVCVLPTGRVDDGLAMAEDNNVILTVFGDMMRVPGTKGTPLEHKAHGADIRMVYSPLDALKLAQNNPERQVVFFAIGFETTAPSTALTLRYARTLGLKNFSVFCNHVMVIPAIRAILDAPDMRLDGLIGPGHVSTVIGCHPYQFVASEFGRPLVVSGFEPLDVLQSIMMILQQLRQGRASIENQYGRVVPWDGNQPALRAMKDVFELRALFEWRGLGMIAESAFKLRPEYADFDAEVRFNVPNVRISDPQGAQCGEVLKGVLKPPKCRLFGKECSPENPVGALMVSSEGACAAYHQYVHRQSEAAD